MIRDRAAIVGIGQTEYSSNSGRSESRLALEAIHAAVADAGLSPVDVNGLVKFGVSQSGVSEAWLAQNLGVHDLRYWSGVDFGGAGSAAVIGHAAAAIGAGLADVVVCYRAMNGRSGSRPGTSDTYKRVLGEDVLHDNHFVQNGLSGATQLYALMAQRHMHEYGTTQEQLALVAIAARDHANRNQRAQMFHRTLGQDSYFQSPMISSPLRKFDCCLQTDGAAAVVLVSAERAKDLPTVPAYVKGAAQFIAHRQGGPLYSVLAHGNITHTNAYGCANTLYQRTGYSAESFDTVQLYDCFTITVMLQLEAYGFCGPGESGAYVTDVGIGPSGSNPVNTAGGNLSEGYMQGLNHVIEAVRQLRGESSNQIADASLALATGGPPMASSAVVLGSARD